MKSVTGERAWTLLGLLITVYEFLAPDDQLLSEAVDRFIIRHPWWTRLVIALVAGHLMNVVPTRVDPLHIIFLARKHRRHSAPLAATLAASKGLPGTMWPIRLFGRLRGNQRVEP